MLFSSFTYLLGFLPIVVIGHALLRRVGPRIAQAWLLVASLAFYAWGKPQSLVLLVGSIVANALLAQTMARQVDEAAKRNVLRLGLLLNILLLCVFKYARFFLSGLFALGAPRFPLPTWEFPLGISFFTLAQVMYLVDCYEGLVPAQGLFDHATFVSFFAYVTSGPLAKAKAIVKQLHDSGVGADLRARGLYLFSIGLFKKVLFADSFGRVADLGYAAHASWSSLEAWAFSLAYTLQLYFDFSGYSDMALGSALMVGIEIPRNFNAPYRSRTVTEFWQRWHMSLSSFITTYLYTPILQSFPRATLGTAAIATLVSMSIAGLWHGPALTYVVFGVLHGCALVVNQVWKKKVKKKLPFLIAWGLTFAFVNLTFVFFRSPNLGTALHIARLLVPLHAPLGTSVLSTVRTLGIVTLVPPLCAGAVLAFFGKCSDELADAFRPSYATAIASALLLLVAALYMNSNIGQAFVYFNF